MWIRKEKGRGKKKKEKKKEKGEGRIIASFFFVYFTFYPINSSPRTCSKSILSVSPPTAIMFSAAVRPRRTAAIPTFGAAFAASGNASRCSQVPSNSKTTHHRSCSGRPSRCLPSLPRLSRPLRSAPPRSRRCGATSVLTSYERAHVVERCAPAISGPARPHTSRGPARVITGRLPRRQRRRLARREHRAQCGGFGDPPGDDARRA